MQKINTLIDSATGQVVTMISDREPVYLFTDGACSGNPGVGGWAALLRWRREEKLISGGVMLTTNNRMEMMGALQGLRLLKKPSEVIVTTDSLYLQKGMTEWVVGWQKKGLLEKPNGRIKNQDLWKALLDAALPHKVRWCWVKGHAGHAENERVDRAARVALVQIKLEQAEGEM